MKTITQEKYNLVEKRYNRLMEKVRQMRAYQRKYFKYRIQHDLMNSKKFEREVDNLITEETKRLDSQQRELF